MWAAYSSVIVIVCNTRDVTQTKERVKKLVSNERAGGFVTSVLGSSSDCDAGYAHHPTRSSGFK